MGYFLAI